MGIKIFLMNREGIQTPTLPVEATGCFIEVKHWSKKMENGLKQKIMVSEWQEFKPRPSRRTDAMSYSVSEEKLRQIKKDRILDPL